MSITSKDLFILASESPRRREILKSVGLKFKIVPAHVNEKYLAGESPRQHVKRLACDKAMAVALKYPEAWILGADTIVVIDGMILGKPKNEAQAKSMLQRLSGREHKVFTGFSIVRIASKAIQTKVVQSAVKFKTISPEELQWYVACDEPYDKAGGYLRPNPQ